MRGRGGPCRGLGLVTLNNCFVTVFDIFFTLKGIPAKMLYASLADLKMAGARIC